MNTSQMFGVTFTICIFSSQNPFDMIRKVSKQLEEFQCVSNILTKMQRLENIIFWRFSCQIWKILSIRTKIETMCLLTVHGEDSTPVAFFEHVEPAQFHGCCSAFFFVWVSDGQRDCLVDPLDGGTALDAVYSSTASWHSAGRRTQFLWRLLYTIDKTF